MKKYSQVIPKGKTLFVGLDLHRNSWHLTVVAEDEIIFSFNMPPEPDTLLKFLSRYQKNVIRVVYEAGCFGYSLYRLLNDSGIHCIVTPPTLVPIECGNRVKTDRRDSKKLALLLSKNMLKEVWIPSKQLLAHRQVLRTRQQLMKDRIRLQQRILGELCFHGVPVAKPRGPWSAKFIKQLKDIIFADSYLQQSFWVKLEQLDQQNLSLEQQTSLLKELSKNELYAKHCQLLQTVPGIGLISAMTIVLELGDISRFGKAEQLAAYAGLTPAQYSSGEHIRMGRITRCGNSSLRAILTEVSWTAIRKDPELKAVYDNIRSRREAKKANIAVARRLLLRCRRILLDQRPYIIRQAA